MNDLLLKTLEELRVLYKAQSVTPSEVTKAYLSQMNSNKHLNAYITTCEETALQQAKESNERYLNGTARALEGMPISVKDIFCTKGIKTTSGSKILDNFIPEHESFVTQKLLDAGAIVLGKTNMDEFAMGSTNTYSAFGDTLNPYSDSTKQGYIAGGSSGGSASSVGSYQALLGLGSDTGGSVRQPGAFCGIVGIRPTYGTCSRRGMIAFSSSLDQAGIHGRDVISTAKMLEVIMAKDPYDQTCTGHDHFNLKDLDTNISQLKIGILSRKEKVSDPEILEQLEQTASWFKEQGCEMEEIEIPHMDACAPTYYIITPGEVASNLARYDGIRYGTKGTGYSYQEQCINARKFFGPEVKRRLLMGTYFSSSDMYTKYFNQANNVRKLIKHEFCKIFQKYDIILSPTTPHTSFPIAENKDPVELYNEDFFTSPVNISGNCAISVPVGFSKKGLPIGMQIIAPALHEKRLIQAGLFVEKQADFKGNPNMIA